MSGLMFRPDVSDWHYRPRLFSMASPFAINNHLIVVTSPIFTIIVSVMRLLAPIYGSYLAIGVPFVNIGVTIC